MVNMLNIGCGEFKKKGYINLDIDPKVNPDVVHDLNIFPYPFPSEYFDVIVANHVLEHLDSPFEVMKELHRILNKNGKLIIRVPHFSRGFTHADHKRGFDIHFYRYFDPSFKGGYSGVEFKLLSVRLRWFAQPYLKRTVMPRFLYLISKVFGKFIDFFANLSPVFCSRVWCFWVGGFEEIEFVFVKA
jgi:SAM-dependent methyltransferase